METSLSQPDDREPDQTSPDGEALLTVLGDEDCRAILRAVAERDRPATAVATACDLPLSTTYRKLNRLEAAGLLVERTRVDPSHNHHSVYAAPPVDVTVSLAADGSLSVAADAQ